MPAEPGQAQSPVTVYSQCVSSFTKHSCVCISQAPDPSANALAFDQCAQFLLQRQLHALESRFVVIIIINKQVQQLRAGVTHL